MAENNRRRNAPELRRKIRSLGVHAEIGTEADLEDLRKLFANEPDEEFYPTTWKAIQPQLFELLRGEREPVKLAPYDVTSFGFLRANPAALVEALSSEPFEFDLDGFWIAGSFGAVHVDFDDAQPGADVLWQRYKPTSVEHHAED